MFDDFIKTDVEDGMRAILGNMKYNNDKLMQASTEYRRFREKTGMVFKRIITYHNANAELEKKEDVLWNRVTCIVNDFPFDIKADISIY
jgi:ABC-type phosphate transport system ATPase subunit